MKIRNDDLAGLNEVKLDLLSPPYSFRLSNIAAGYIDKTIELISKYVDGSNTYIDQLKDIKAGIQSTTDMTSIKKLCLDAAAIINYFTLGG